MELPPKITKKELIEYYDKLKQKHDDLENKYKALKEDHNRSQKIHNRSQKIHDNIIKQMRADNKTLKIKLEEAIQEKKPHKEELSVEPEKTQNKSVCEKCSTILSEQTEVINHNKLLMKTNHIIVKELLTTRTHNKELLEANKDIIDNFRNMCIAFNIIDGNLETPE